MAIQTGPSTSRPGSTQPPQPDWATAVAVAKAGFSDVVNQWIANASVDAGPDRGTTPLKGNGTIEGQWARLRASCLISQVTAPVASMRAALTQVTGITNDIGTAFAEVLWSAWTGWAAQFSADIFVPDWTPWNMWAASNTGDWPMGPGTLQAPSFITWALTGGSSTGESGLSAGALSSQILGRLAPIMASLNATAQVGSPAPPPASSPSSGGGTSQPIPPTMTRTLATLHQIGGGSITTTGKFAAGAARGAVAIAYDPPDAAVNDLARWVNASFQAWKASVKLTNLWGFGEVLGWDPVRYPAGPVTEGWIWGSNVLQCAPFPYQ